MSPVAKLKSPGELETLRKSITGKRDANKTIIAICNGTGCQAYGCKSVTAAFQDEIKKQDLAAKVELKPIGCPGFCERGTIVVVKPQGVFYQRVRPRDVPEVIAASVRKEVVQ